MGETQIIDGFGPEYRNWHAHHYNYMLHWVETGRYGAPGRQ